MPRPKRNGCDEWLFSQRCAAPVVWWARGCALIPFPSRQREGAERRAAPLKSTPCGAGARRLPDARRLALHGGDFAPRGRASGDGREPVAPRSGRLSPAFIRPASSPQGADPRSWVGRLPGASRARACEARTQAPHLAPPTERLRKAPSDEQGAAKIRAVQGAGISSREESAGAVRTARIAIRPL